MARRSREQTESVADIGELPPVADPARRESCRLDLPRFLTTYFPNSTGLKPFGDDQQRAISRIQDCAINGGLFTEALPRGFAKTTISENSSLWVVLYGHRKFVPVFGADAGSADAIIDSIKLELSENDLLYADFPEVCHAIRALEGKPQRCASQTYRWPCEACKGKGKVGRKKCLVCDGRGRIARQTHIEWTADQIVLPTMPDSPASGAILSAHGITAASRGMKHKRPDGTQQRPDFVIIDDPQTDESAASPLQVDKRLDVIRKSILKLGGHNRRIACVMNATIIQPDDLVAQLLDPKRFPAWQGERVKMVRAWSKVHETLWMTDYARIRNEYDPQTLGDQQRAHLAATEFYRRNRAAMDEGCEVAWEHCFDETAEDSAIQHAYNALIDDGPEVFASECQNEPLVMRIEGQQDTLTAEQIQAKVNRLPRGVLPAEATRLVGFIDVHDKVLYWGVAAFGDGFTGGVVDYGTWPDQRRPYFAAREVRRTIAKETKATGFEAQMYAALDALVNDLMARDWKREDGAVLKPERIPIDAGDGDHAETVKLFCRRSPHAAILIPSNGLYIGAKRSSLNDREPQTGERRGWNWKIAPHQGTRGILKFDTNAWKTRMHGFWAVPMGGKGCLTLFGADKEAHRMFSEHQVAEYPVLVTAGGRTVKEWQVKIGAGDNHYLDVLVGCGVAAGTLGVDVASPEPKRARVKLSELQKRNKRVWTTNGVRVA